MEQQVQAAFFASLPGHELLPWEKRLRKALLQAAGDCNREFVERGMAFPLSDWIDQRIGGEMVTRGSLQISMRNGLRSFPGAAQLEPVASKEEFLESLHPEAFAAPEEALREAVYEFLVSWRSTDLATVRDLSECPAVRRCAAAFLPPNVPIGDWIQYRIGGEIEFSGQRNGSDIMVLTDVAKECVLAKYRQLSEAPQASSFSMGPAGMVGAPADANGEKIDKSAAWFDALPPDQLLPAECQLRDALIISIQESMVMRKGKPFVLSDAGSDARVKAAKAAVGFPKGVSMAEWIERRVGAEIVLRKQTNSEVIALHLGPAASVVPLELPRELLAVPQVRMQEKDNWFDSLPVGSFTPVEEALREALLNFIDCHVGPGPAVLSDASCLEEVGKWRKELLPGGKSHPVKFKDWIDRRIGGEIETRFLDNNGKVAIARRGMMPAFRGPPPNKKRKKG